MTPGWRILCYRPFALWMLGYPDAAHADADQRPQGRPRDRPCRHVADRAATTHRPPICFAGIIEAATAVIRRSCSHWPSEKGAPSNGRQPECSCAGWLVGPDRQRLRTQLSRSPPESRPIGQREQRHGLHRIYRISPKPMLSLGNSTRLGAASVKRPTMIETTGERWWEADIYRRAGDIALMAPERDAAKAQACFERALAVARRQQAKSWELRAAMSVARLRRDQGKRDEARDLLAPVYGWFTEGFDTLDLKEAKVAARRIGCMSVQGYAAAIGAHQTSSVLLERPDSA